MSTSFFRSPQKKQRGIAGLSPCFGESRMLGSCMSVLPEGEVETRAVAERQRALAAVALAPDDHEGRHEAEHLEVAHELVGGPHRPVLGLELLPVARVGVEVLDQRFANRFGRVGHRHHHPSPFERYSPSPVMMWSKTRMPRSSPACSRRSVSARSSAEGSAEPEGWLCSKITAAALARITGLKTSRGWTSAAVKLPIETTLKPSTW